MSSINPTMGSVASQAFQAYSQNSPVSAASQTQAAASTGSPSTTVSLSNGQPQGVVDYSDINNQQTVRNATQVQQNGVNDNEISSGMTYATSLQNQSSYFLTQQANNMTNASGNTTETQANQNANIASV